MTCEELVQTWGISPHVAVRFLLLRSIFRLHTGRDVSIISGFRTCAAQERLKEMGRPTAPCHLSNHVQCPSTAVDVRIDGFVTRALKVAFGSAAVEAGFRWGGGSPLDGGIPSDWNHVDLGPRR